MSDQMIVDPSVETPDETDENDHEAQNESSIDWLVQRIQHGAIRLLDRIGRSIDSVVRRIEHLRDRLQQRWIQVHRLLFARSGATEIEATQITEPSEGRTFLISPRLPGTLTETFWKDYGSIIVSTHERLIRQMVRDLEQRHEQLLEQTEEQFHVDQKNFQGNLQALRTQILQNERSRCSKQLSDRETRFGARMVEWSYRRLEHIIVMDEAELVLEPLLRSEAQLFDQPELRIVGPAYLRPFFETRAFVFETHNHPNLILYLRDEPRWLIDLQNAYQMFFQTTVRPMLEPELNTLISARVASTIPPIETIPLIETDRLIRRFEVASTEIVNAR